MNQPRRRCPQCLYLRHPNDSARCPPDTCPACGRLYTKSLRRIERERRARSFRAHRLLELRNCPACRESVSLYATQCPHCYCNLKGGHSARLATLALALLLPLGFALKARFVALPASPLPGLSNAHYARCISLARDHLATATENPAGTTALASMNAWHAECSPKALREIVISHGAAVPASPQSWLELDAARASRAAVEPPPDAPYP